MPRDSCRRFLTAAVPALALAAPAPAAAQEKPPATAPRKRVYRASTGPFKKDGPPLYSQEVSFGNLVFVSGKGAGVDFNGDIRAHTRRVLDLMEESLKTAGSSMDKVLRVTVYLTDIKDYDGMNETYLGRFGPAHPVRTMVAVTAIPDRTLVEMDCIAQI
jgi:enamine deaminase RidA (YjgF/YER057c/UK114 family)